MKVRSLVALAVFSFFSVGSYRETNAELIFRLIDHISSDDLEADDIFSFGPNGGLFSVYGPVPTSSHYLGEHVEFDGWYDASYGGGTGILDGEVAAARPLSLNGAHTQIRFRAPQDGVNRCTRVFDRSGDWW